MNYSLKPDIINDNQYLLQKLLDCHVSNQKQAITNILSLIMANDQGRCVARIHDKTQCTRKCKDIHTRLCGSHMNSLPYGRIDDAGVFKDSYRKMRGRKNKSNHDDSSGAVDLSKYIKTETIIIDDKEFLIDQNNLLFDTSENHTLVGIKQSETQFKWF